MNVRTGLAMTVLLVFGPLSQGWAQEAPYDPEARLVELGIELPDAPAPVANYVNGVQTGNLIFVAGKGPRRRDGSRTCAS